MVIGKLVFRFFVFLCNSLASGTFWFPVLEAGHSVGRAHKQRVFLADVTCDMLTHGARHAHKRPFLTPSTLSQPA